ncbi:MAG: hypothetical protein JWO33_439 [Caulobacteraceae bacterium]|nr:hypothetical protein [Caulobacteraceae bacterium]
MASRFPSRSFAPRKAKAAARTLTAPPLPSLVVDAVLRFHDQAEDQGSGRTLLRLSPGRLHDAEVEAALGDLAPRAARVSILWNERESEIIRVLEGRLAA